MLGPRHVSIDRFITVGARRKSSAGLVVCSGKTLQEAALSGYLLWHWHLITAAPHSVKELLGLHRAVWTSRLSKCRLNNFLTSSLSRSPSFNSVAVIKRPNKSYFKKERVYLVTVSGYSLSLWGNQYRNLKQTSHPQSRAERQWEHKRLLMRSPSPPRHTHTPSPDLTNPGLNSREWSHPQWVSRSSGKPTGQPDQDSPSLRLFPGDLRLYQIDR